MPRIVCAPDSFKGSISASRAAQAMARGIRAARADAEVDCCPVGDGGEGTLDALIGALEGTFITRSVIGPTGRAVAAAYGWVEREKLAIIELASAAGLTLVPEDQRDPMKTTTYGAGQLMDAATMHRPRRMIVAIGGSATVDGGCGLAQAMGVRFLDEQGGVIGQPITGGMLQRIDRWEPAQRHLPPISVACDVRNPLLGPDGAARVYGPQKGATDGQVERLERGLAHLAQITGVDPDQGGFGASGGAGFGLHVFLGAKLESGIKLVLDAVHFTERLAGADLVLTGEGRLDAQTMHGKACAGVALAAGEQGVPTIAIAGSVEGLHRDGPFERVVSLTDRFGVDRSMEAPEACLEQVSQDLAAEHYDG